MLIIVHYRRTGRMLIITSINDQKMFRLRLNFISCIYFHVRFWLFYQQYKFINLNVYAIKYQYCYEPILISLKALAKIVNKKSRIHQFDGYIIPLTPDKKIKSTKFNQKISFFEAINRWSLETILETKY